MTIRYQCKECGSVLNIKDEKAGTQGRCPKCKGEFVVPQPEQAAALVADAAAESVAAAESKPAAAATGNDDLSEDEIEKLLESKEGLPAADSDYSVTGDDSDDESDSDSDDGLDDDDDLDDGLDDDVPGSDSDDEVGAPRDTKPGKAKGQAGRGKGKKDKPERSTVPQAAPADIAKNLMARGDKKGGDKKGSVAVAERDGKKSSRPFGGDDRDDEAGGFSVKEIVGYFARNALPIVLLLSAGIGYYIYWFRQWEKGEIPPLAPVSGTVKLDGKPLAQAQVLFIPVAEGQQPNLKLGPSVAFTDEAGRYTLVYKSPITGAVIGKHLVQISATDKEGHELIPPSFGARSKKIVEVKASGDKALDFDVPSQAAQDTSGAAGGFTPPGK